MSPHVPLHLLTAVLGSGLGGGLSEQCWETGALCWGEGWQVVGHGGVHPESWGWGGGALGTAGRGGEGTPSLTPTHCDPQQPPPRAPPGPPTPMQRAPATAWPRCPIPPPLPPPPDSYPSRLSFTPSLLFLERERGEGKKRKKKEKRSQTPKQEAGACFASQAIFLEPIGMRTHPAPLPN